MHPSIITLFTLAIASCIHAMASPSHDPHVVAPPCLDAHTCPPLPLHPAHSSPHIAYHPKRIHFPEFISAIATLWSRMVQTPPHLLVSTSPLLFSYMDITCMPPLDDTKTIQCRVNKDSVIKKSTVEKTFQFVVWQWGNDDIMAGMVWHGRQFRMQIGNGCQGGGDAKELCMYVEGVAWV